MGSFQAEARDEFACTNCPKIFFTKRQLYDHWRSNHEEPGSCSACGKSCASKKRLKEHIKIVHGASVQNLCPLSVNLFENLLM